MFVVTVRSCSTSAYAARSAYARYQFALSIASRVLTVTTQRIRSGLTIRGEPKQTSVRDFLSSTPRSQSERPLASRTWSHRAGVFRLTTAVAQSPLETDLPASVGVMTQQVLCLRVVDRRDRIGALSCLQSLIALTTPPVPVATPRRFVDVAGGIDAVPA